MSKNFIIVVDFDGTIVLNSYPSIGTPIPNAIDSLRVLQNKPNVKLVLYSMRSGDSFKSAADFLISNDIKIVGHNHNLKPERINMLFSPPSRQVYISAIALGAPMTPSCDGPPDSKWADPHFDWKMAMEILIPKIDRFNQEIEICDKENNTA